jgi:hypothetical protein
MIIGVDERMRRLLGALGGEYDVGLDMLGYAMANARPTDGTAAAA